jgi:hypothetical protein
MADSIIHLKQQQPSSIAPIVLVPNVKAENLNHIDSIIDQYETKRHLSCSTMHNISNVKRDIKNALHKSDWCNIYTEVKGRRYTKMQLEKMYCYCYIELLKQESGLGYFHTYKHLPSLENREKPNGIFRDSILPYIAHKSIVIFLYNNIKVISSKVIKHLKNSKFKDKQVKKEIFSAIYRKYSDYPSLNIENIIKSCSLEKIENYNVTSIEKIQKDKFYELATLIIFIPYNGGAGITEKADGGTDTTEHLVRASCHFALKEDHRSKGKYKLVYCIDQLYPYSNKRVERDVKGKEIIDSQSYVLGGKAQPMNLILDDTLTSSKLILRSTQAQDIGSEELKDIYAYAQ